MKTFVLIKNTVKKWLETGMFQTSIFT